MDDFVYGPPDHLNVEIKTTWEEQASQFPLHGEPGITYQQLTIGPPDNNTIVDVLLYRDDDGVLVGILAKYNENNPLQEPDSVNLLVKPDQQRRGIGKSLAREACTRWPHILQVKGTKIQHWTAESLGWADALVAKGEMNETRTEWQ